MTTRDTTALRAVEMADDMFQTNKLRELVAKGSSYKPSSDENDNNKATMIGWNETTGSKKLPDKVVPKINRQVRTRMVQLTASRDCCKLFVQSQDGTTGSSDGKKAVLYKHSDILLGDELNHGGFSSIYAVKSILKSGQKQPKTRNKYVVKIMREKLVNDPNLFAGCASDLAGEAFLMASLNHPHILKVRGWGGADGIAGYATSKRHDAFFLVLDRLAEDTLKERIEQGWKDREARSQVGFAREQKAFKLLADRLQVAIQLANAVAYLHRNNILHRDLKPSNVGFDERTGDVKLFDMGVSRPVPVPTKADEAFFMTGATGTKRYMCPECAKCKPYNLKADVYSFGVILYEILSLSYAFKEVPSEDHHFAVFVQGYRPPIESSWSDTMKRLIEDSWADDHCQRPNMRHVLGLLRAELRMMYIKQKRNNRGSWGRSLLRCSMRTAPFLQRFSFGNDTNDNNPVVVCT